MQSGCTGRFGGCLGRSWSRGMRWRSARTMRLELCLPLHYTLPHHPHLPTHLHQHLHLHLHHLHCHHRRRRRRRPSVDRRRPLPTRQPRHLHHRRRVAADPSALPSALFFVQHAPVLGAHPTLHLLTHHTPQRTALLHHSRPPPTLTIHIHRWLRHLLPRSMAKKAMLMLMSLMAAKPCRRQMPIQMLGWPCL